LWTCLCKHFKPQIAMIGLRRGLLFYDFQNKLNVIEALKII
jgi:hypothetical protein